jgi:hypothetical protein
MKKSRSWKYAELRPALAIIALLGCCSAGAEEPAPTDTSATTAPAKNWQIHGFASQGFIHTDENNFYGESSDGGSFDYYEVGVNGLWQFNDRFSVSGQILAREAGETDDGKLRLDYGFFDYRFINMDAARAGMRIGRVKNPLGFYNETRDVLFTRPSILLPQSIYLEGTGIRELLFSSDGIQFYSDWDHDQHHTAFKMNIARDTEASDQTRKNFTSGSLPPGVMLDNLDINDLFFMQVLDEIDGGRIRLALSYLTGTVDATFVPAFIPPAAIDAEFITLSGQYNQERWSLTSEYSLTSTEIDFFGMADKSRSEGIYLQGQYRLTPEWTGLLRYDLSYGDRNDRGDSDARDVTAGLSWTPKPSWIVMGEYHYIHGSNGDAGIPRVDNEGSQIQPRTRLFAMMVGYRF